MGADEKSMEDCHSSWDLGLVINLGEIERRGKSAVPWKMLQWPFQILQSRRVSPLQTGRKAQDTQGYPASLECTLMFQLQFSRSNSFSIIALTLI